MKICFNLTNQCNEDCTYCFRELYERPLSLSDNLTIIRKLKYAGVESITYAGGEPLIYKDLPELMNYSKSLGIQNNLITNGKLLTKENISKYLVNVDKITFSIDSPSEYVNEKIGRGKSHYEHIKELIPYIHEIFPSIILEINSVVTRNTIKEVDYMFESIGGEISFSAVKKWKISRFCPLRGYAKERENLLGLPDEVFQAIKDRYDGQKAAFEISVRDHNDINNNIIVSPAGKLKISEDNNEKVIIDNILTTSSNEIKKRLTLGGYYVQQ